MTRYAKPTSLEDAVALLGEGDWTILAGGTDFYPALGSKPLRCNVLDINALGELRGVTKTDQGIRIGALTTWTEILRADLLPGFDALKQAAREVGSIQIQNCGTVAGNLCNASPAADGIPPLLILGAEVELASMGRTRQLPLGDFMRGNRKTALVPGELLTAIYIPGAATDGRSAFLKLGSRRYLVISIAMVAARIVADAEGRIVNAAVAVGSCSEVARRLTNLENRLVGMPLDIDPCALIEAETLDELSPIDDVRGSADYRREAARVLIARCIRGAAGAYSKPAEQTNRGVA